MLARPALWRLRPLPSRRVTTMAGHPDGPFSYAWPRPGLTVDVAVLSPSIASTSTSLTPPTAVLLIQRGIAPGRGRWALPGGFVNPEEELELAAARELEEETGLGNLALRQVRAWGGPDRDPRGWTVTVAFVAVLPERGGSEQPPPVKGGDDAAAARWWPVAALPDLAFDHQRILAHAFRSVAGVGGEEEGGGAWGLVAAAEALEARPWAPTRE